jgi:hypothetical protein
MAEAKHLTIHFTTHILSMSYSLACKHSLDAVSETRAREDSILCNVVYCSPYPTPRRLCKGSHHGIKSALIKLYVHIYYCFRGPFCQLRPGAQKTIESVLRVSPPAPPKRLPKCRRWNLGSGPKLVHHRQAQNLAGAHWIPNKQPTLPRWLLRGRTLSGAPALHGTLEKWAQACLAGKINPQILPSPRLPPFAAGDDAPLSSSPPPPWPNKKAL